MERPICNKCNEKYCVKYYSKRRKRPFRKICWKCRKSYNKFYVKKDRCDLCGFISINMCQLDKDHIDGDHKNNDISNLQTLCANCHRLKTFLNKDWRS